MNSTNIAGSPVLGPYDIVLKTYIFLLIAFLIFNRWSI